MTYKLLASDMDDTLLDDQGKITLRTQAAIRKLVDSGIYFVPATGKVLSNVEYVAEIFKGCALELPFITYNGAMVVMQRTKEILFSANMEAQSAKEIFEMGLEKNLLVRVCTQDSMYFGKDSEEAQAYQKKVNFKVEFVGSSPDNTIDALAKKGIIKIVWKDDPEIIRTYQGEIIKHFAGRVNAHTSVPFQLEFVDVSASKAVALEKISERLGISCEEMIAVGDGYNDLSMLKRAGYSVAMGNAPDDIKEVCDHVTLSNTEDGVAVFIEDFFKQGKFIK